MTLTATEELELKILTKIKNEPDYIQTRLKELNEKEDPWKYDNVNGQYYLHNIDYKVEFATIVQVCLNGELYFALFVNDNKLGYGYEDMYKTLLEAKRVGEATEKYLEFKKFLENV